MFAMSGSRSGGMRRGSLRVLLPIFAGALLSACASGGAVRATQRAEAPESSTSLVIDNRYQVMVTVYLATSGKPYRIGDVAGSSERTFSLDEFRFALDGREAFLVARPQTGHPVRSDAFRLAQGRTMMWTIEQVRALTQVASR